MTIPQGGKHWMALYTVPFRLIAIIYDWHFLYRPDRYARAHARFLIRQDPSSHTDRTNMAIFTLQIQNFFSANSPPPPQNWFHPYFNTDKFNVLRHFLKQARHGSRREQWLVEIFTSRCKGDEISHNYLETGHFFNLDALMMVARWLMKVLQICREFWQKTAMR